MMHGPAMIPSINSLPLGQPPVLQSQYSTQAAGQQYAFPHSALHTHLPDSISYPNSFLQPVHNNVHMHTQSQPAAHMPNLMEMAISSSYGIPRPKLISFTTGKESDFLLLKKGLDGVLGPDYLYLSEDYKFQVLLDHLKFPSAFQIAKRYVHDPMPYTKAMQALQQRYGQPRQLVQGEINTILNAPAVKYGDAGSLCVI